MTAERDCRLALAVSAAGVLAALARLDRRWSWSAARSSSLDKTRCEVYWPVGGWPDDRTGPARRAPVWTATQAV